MTMHILEKAQIVAGFAPVDMSLAANTGDDVSLSGYGRGTIVFFKGADTAGQDPGLP